MAGVYQLVFLTSVLLLAHAAYSAYEFAQFRKHVPSSSELTKVQIPLDIQLEAIGGVIAAIAGAVLAVAGTLKPIKFSKSVSELEAKGKSPFALLESRPGFQDIIAKRREYSEWVKNVKK